MSGYGDEGPGPGAPPFDFSSPLPLLRATFDIAHGDAACRICPFRASYDTGEEGWAMPLLRHAWSHGLNAAPAPVAPRKKTTVTREPRERATRTPSTPADLESLGLFE
jgi:hypothetical protein